MAPGLEAPLTWTAVPTGSEPDEHPSVAVLPPVPEQWAACPTYTLLLESEKTKLAVHCAPFVNVCTPGWIGALAAGAHVGVAWMPAVLRARGTSARTALPERNLRSDLIAFE